MAPKRAAAAPQSSTTAVTAAPSSATSSSATGSTTAITLTPNSPPKDIVLHVWQQYINHTPPRTLLLDAFMGFLVLVGVVQFVYCVVAGNYPFNAFLSGFGASVGQFVLTASLRMQTSEKGGSGSLQKARSAAKASTGSVVATDEQTEYSSERAFADYVFGSLLLHFFCVNFIN